MSTDQEKTLPTDLASRLIQHTNSFLEDVEDLVYFLPHWISYRSDMVESLRASRKSTGPLSCLSPAVSSIGSALVDKFQQVDHKVAAVASTIGSALSFGFTCGMNKAKQEFNNRRLNAVASCIREDRSNTVDLEAIIRRVMESLDAVLKDFQACWDLPADQRDSNQMLREVGSILTSPTGDSGTIQYQSLIGWADQVKKLLHQFLEILGRSSAPNEQLQNLLQRNPTPNVVLERSELDRWVAELEKGYTAIQNARNAAQQNAQFANNFLSRMLTSSSSGAVTAATAQRASNSFGGGNGASFGARDTIDESTNEIDRWFEEVRRLIIESIEVAEEVSRLISEEHIPLKRGSEKQLHKTK